MATSPPFGLVIPSRPVLTQPVTVSPTQYAFTFPATPTFTHIVLFLLPGCALPEGTLAGVYIQLPSSAPTFTLLGAIGTEQQSAIFTVRATTTRDAADAAKDPALDDAMTDVAGVGMSTTLTGTAADAGAYVTVGISIEPAAGLRAQLETIGASQSSHAGLLVSTNGAQPRSAALTTLELAQRIIQNAFNFLASFTGSTSVGGQGMVPLKSFQDWWTKFERRIQVDPGFLERELDG